jgi:hypothetical protein
MESPHVDNKSKSSNKKNSSNSIQIVSGDENIMSLYMNSLKESVENGNKIYIINKILQTLNQHLAKVRNILLDLNLIKMKENY